MKFIHTHMGLGDHVVCTGLIRELAKREGHIATFCKHHNYESVKSLYAGAPVTIIPVADDAEAFDVCQAVCPSSKDVIGFWKRDMTLPFDQAFYKCAGVPFEKRWDSFGFDDRVEDLGLVYDFFFVHDDERFQITKMQPPDGVNVYRPTKGEYADFTKWRQYIRHAKEIHCIESCFAFFADSIPTRPDANLFIHRYARPLPANELPTYRKPWKILE